MNDEEFCKEAYLEISPLRGKKIIRGTFTEHIRAYVGSICVRLTYKYEINKNLNIPLTKNVAIKIFLLRYRDDTSDRLIYSVIKVINFTFCIHKSLLIR